MNTKSWRKGEVVAAIAVLLLSAIFLAGAASALEPETGDMRFVVIYKDVNTGDSDFLPDVDVMLFDMDGNYVASSVSQSNGIVTFNDVVYGNYVIKTEGTVKGNYFYSKAYEAVKFDSTGIYTLDGTEFKSLNVDRYALENELNVTVVNGGTNIESTVTLYFQGVRIGSSATYFNDTGVYLTALLYAPSGEVTMKVTYEDGGVMKSVYREYTITGNQNITVDVAASHKIWGIVYDASTGMPVGTDVHITLINTTTGAFKTLSFQGGPFSFYLADLGYKVIITADGYGIATYTASQLSQSTPEDIWLPSVTNNFGYTVDISDNFQWINVTYTRDITNETVLYSLPYNDTGVLYYQLKFLGKDNTFLENYLANDYKNYTSDFITVDGNVYEIAAHTYTWTPVDPANEEFTITLTLSYKNTEISKDSLLSDGKINLDIYAQGDSYMGAKNVYTYTINLPSDMERSNEITGATVENYVGSITITNVETSPLTLVLKERKNPEMRLDPHNFVFGWENMPENNFIVNQSSDNYTIVVPAGKDVWFNASSMVFDVVRGLVDEENTTYTWLVDGNQQFSGMGVYNVTLSFATGKHVLQIKAMDVGENTNVTNVTVLADSYFPTVNINMKFPTGEELGTIMVNDAFNQIDYNITGSTGAVNIVNYTAIIPVELVLNESQEVVYDASSTVDTYNGTAVVDLPVTAEWNFSGELTTGLNKTYAFDVPSRAGNFWINVTFTDAVNNSVTIKLKVVVKDITPPVPKVNITVAGEETHEVKEGENITFDATSSYDPDNGTIVSYNWTIMDSDYNVLNETSDLFEFVNGTFTSANITLKFNRYGTYYVILNVTDADGNYKELNNTIVVTPVRPDLAVSDVEIQGDRVEDKEISFVVNVTNNGNANASVYYIIILVDGKEVENYTFYNLTAGGYAVNTVKHVFKDPNNYTVTIKVYTPDEPSTYLSDNEKEMTVKIEQAPWKTPAMVLGVIAVIILLAYLGWMAQKKKLLQGRFTKKTKGKKEKS